MFVLLFQVSTVIYMKISAWNIIICVCAQARLYSFYLHTYIYSALVSNDSHLFYASPICNFDWRLFNNYMRTKASTRRVYKFKKKFHPLFLSITLIWKIKNRAFSPVSKIINTPHFTQSSCRCYFFLFNCMLDQ